MTRKKSKRGNKNGGGERIEEENRKKDMEAELDEHFEEMPGVWRRD